MIIVFRTKQSSTIANIYFRRTAVEKTLQISILPHGWYLYQSTYWQNLQHRLDHYVIFFTHLTCSALSKVIESVKIFHLVIYLDRNELPYSIFQKHLIDCNIGLIFQNLMFLASVIPSLAGVQSENEFFSTNFESAVRFIMLSIIREMADPIWWNK